jgi:hypothetical protein
MDSDDGTACAVGCPIRRSRDHRSLASPPGFSQRATSFIASQCQGIHQMPFLGASRHTQRQGPFQISESQISQITTMRPAFGVIPGSSPGTASPVAAAELRSAGANSSLRRHYGIPNARLHRRARSPASVTQLASLQLSSTTHPSIPTRDLPGQTLLRAALAGYRIRNQGRNPSVLISDICFLISGGAWWR